MKKSEAVGMYNQYTEKLFEKDIDFAIEHCENKEELTEFLDGLVMVNKLTNEKPDITDQFNVYINAKEEGSINEEYAWTDAIDYMNNTVVELYADTLPFGEELKNVFSIAKEKSVGVKELRNVMDERERGMNEYLAELIEEDMPITNLGIPKNHLDLNGKQADFYDGMLQSVSEMIPESKFNQENYRNDPFDNSHNLEHMMTKEPDMIYLQKD